MSDLFDGVVTREWGLVRLYWLMGVPRAVDVEGAWAAADHDAVLAGLFEEHSRSLVRLARLFVDDLNAAEDLVQEAFLRLDGSLHRVRDRSKAAAYLRSIVMNLARDHNRRGLMSLRHHSSQRVIHDPTSAEDDVLRTEEQREVIGALRELPTRQRDCLVLRHYLELSVSEIAETLGISPNSVKTHLRRGTAALRTRLGRRND